MSSDRDRTQIPRITKRDEVKQKGKIQEWEDGEKIAGLSRKQMQNREEGIYV